MTRLKENEYGPLQPRMLPAAENPRASLFAARDGVTDPRERNERPVTVADGGNAVAQVDLRRFEHDVVLPRLVADERLVAIVLTAVERQVDVGVDQAWEHPPAARVDLARVGGNLNGTS